MRRVVTGEAGSEPAAGAARLRVLVIDDDEGQLRLAERRLGRLGFDVEGRASAAEGLARLESGERFDAVALDHYLPGMDGLQILARTGTLEDFLVAFRSRVGALVAAHQLLVDSGWRGVDLPELARAVLEPQLGDRLGLDIGSVSIDPSTANMLALVFHELATNALKYGALSVPAGRVSIAGRLEDDSRLRLEWRERGGPPPREPEHEGFGLAMI